MRVPEDDARAGVGLVGLCLYLGFLILLICT